MWPALAETLGVDVGADKPTRLATYIRDNADVWARVVAKYGLASGDLRSFIGQGDQHADFAFAYGAPAGPVAFVSTIKLRKAGFNAAVDTRDALRGALQSFIDFEAEAPEQAAVLAAPKLYPGVTPTHKGADNGISSLPNTHHRSSIVADRTAG